MASSKARTAAPAEIQGFKIKWKRLVKDGKTCDRCAETEIELEIAVSKLKEVLKPLGIQVLLLKEEISREEFEKDPLSSNVILINDRPLESYINANVGKSSCCDVCAPHECRTLEFDGKGLRGHKFGADR